MFQLIPGASRSPWEFARNIIGPHFNIRIGELRLLSGDEEIRFLFDPFPWVHNSKATMISLTRSFTVATRGKGTYSLTDAIERIVAEAAIQDGVATVLVAHTSASLVIYENADPTAREDLHRFFERLVPENGDYVHDMEGPDDSTSHLRMALTRSNESIPIQNGRLCLGTWQGVYLFEHRRAPHQRRISVNVTGLASSNA